MALKGLTYKRDVSLTSLALAVLSFNIRKSWWITLSSAKICRIATWIFSMRYFSSITSKKMWFKDSPLTLCSTPLATKYRNRCSEKWVNFQKVTVRNYEIILFKISRLNNKTFSRNLFNSRWTSNLLATLETPWWEKKWKRSAKMKEEII